MLLSSTVQSYGTLAAGALIAEAAGAVVSDWQGGKIFPLGSKAARPAARQRRTVSDSIIRFAYPVSDILVRAFGKNPVRRNCPQNTAIPF